MCGNEKYIEQQGPFVGAELSLLWLRGAASQAETFRVLLYLLRKPHNKGDRLTPVPLR